MSTFDDLVTGFADRGAAFDAAQADLKADYADYRRARRIRVAVKVAMALVVATVITLLIIL